MQTIAPELAELAALIADPGRAGILSRLMDGRAQTASELARVAGVTPQTASWHLARLVERALLKVERRGPRRFYRLATPLVAQMLEGMMTVAAIDPHRSRPPPRIDAEMRRARTCYDHLAGELGVAVTEAMQEHGHLELDQEANRTVCLFALVLCAAGMATGRGDALAPVPAAYVACYFGLMNPRRSWIVSSGDYSYGLYLYGFVIQQCAAAFGPLQHWYLNLLVSLPLSFGVAMASWHLVEKHALRLRGRVEALEAAALSRLSIMGFWRGSPERSELRANLGNSSASI